MSSSSSENLATRTTKGKLTLEDVKRATKDELEVDKHNGSTVLYWASWFCPTEVVEAILDKGVDIDGLSGYVRTYCCW
jgi:hypothetical protein